MENENTEDKQIPAPLEAAGFPAGFVGIFNYLCLDFFWLAEDLAKSADFAGDLM